MPPVERECSSRDELLRKCHEERPGENSPFLTPTPKEQPLCPWLDLDLRGLKLKVGPMALAARE